MGQHQTHLVRWGVRVWGPTQAWQQPAPTPRPGWWERVPSWTPQLGSLRLDQGVRARGTGRGDPGSTLSRLWPPPGGFPRGRRAGRAGPTGVEPASISGGARLCGDRLGLDTVSDLRSRCVRCFRLQTLHAAAHPPRRDPPLRPDPGRERLARWRVPRAENPRSSAVPLLGKLKPYG